MIYTADGKIDLTPHNDEELIDQVINDEFLEGMLYQPSLFDTLDELFVYTAAQKANLQAYIEEWPEEEERLRGEPGSPSVNGMH